MYKVTMRSFGDMITVGEKTYETEADALVAMYDAAHSQLVTEFPNAPVRLANVTLQRDYDTKMFSAYAGHDNHKYQGYYRLEIA